MKALKNKPTTGKRFFAGLIDYTIIYGFTFMLIFGLGTPDEYGTYSLNGFPALIPIALWLVLTVILEITLGATLGNSLVGLMPIPSNGHQRKLTFLESLKRHLLDPLDMFPLGIIGIITINNTLNNQRVGDIWAKTIVVSEKHFIENPI